MENQIISVYDKATNSLIFFAVSLVLIMVGGTLQFFVIDSNNGKMPVLSASYCNLTYHFTYQDASKINNSFLADRINIGKGIFSVGDIFILVGGLMLLTSTIASIYYTKKAKKLKKEFELKFKNRKY